MTKEEVKSWLGILGSNLENREGELMKSFNCNPLWPVCLYDFTYKNKANQFQVMKCKQNLRKYVVQDYINLDSEKREKLIKSRENLESDSDVLREQA